MIRRFSLYGFLKNLRLFEAFLVIALRERGLDYASIGTLIAVREVVTNALEVPSGALADAWGRKRCMVLSFAAYFVSYILLGLADGWWPLAAGMAVYGFGEAFRSGTHKALIHAWLRREGRSDERTAVYGYTRSWSKFGSASSSLLGGAVVAFGADYRWIFLGSAVPAALNLLNLATYPNSLDAAHQRSDIGGSLQYLRAAGRALRRRPRLRGLVSSSVGVEGVYSVVKDYVQPVLATLAVALPLHGFGGDRSRVGLLAGGVGFVLFLLAGAASRRAHRFEASAGSPDAAARALVLGIAALYAGLAASLSLGLGWLAVLAFVGLAAAQNLWRPVHVGRFDEHGAARLEATVLSVESQATSLTAALLAPLLGSMVDHLSHYAVVTPLSALWPVPVAALCLLLVTAGAEVYRTPRRAASS